MNKDYFFLYLIYGFSFINMGLFSIQEKDEKVIKIPLVKSLKYLGYFGISHGISEWITMVTVAKLYPELYVLLFNLKQFLKAISFTYLMYFGISLLSIKDRYKKYIIKIPMVLFLVWSVGFLLLILDNGQDYHILFPKFNIIILRYLLAFLGSTISAIALYLNAKAFKKRKSNKMAERYEALACIFLIYGFLDGLIVRKMNFFPANIINSTIFLKTLKVPTQIIKAAVGVAINYLLIKVMDTFDWEQKGKLRRLEQHRIAYEERRKLGLEIHDSIIQGIYAAGLKVEYLMKDKSNDEKDILDDIKVGLNKTIDKTREFLSSTTLEIIEIEDLKDNLQQLINKFNESQSINISFNCELSLLSYGYLSPEKSTQIYYIVQEAISNVIRHSKATNADVFLNAKSDFLIIRVIDNGIGISMESIDPRKQFGIRSMKERTNRVGGCFNIDRIEKGTRIVIKIPWEEYSYEG